MMTVMKVKKQYVDINKKYDRPTKAIRNAGKVLNMKNVAINKVRGKLKNHRFKMPHYA